MAQVESRNRATSSEESRREVLKRIQNERVEFLAVWFTDTEGHLKSFAVTPSAIEGGVALFAVALDQIEGALDDGMGYDGSSITGFNAIERLDRVAIDIVD